MRTAAVVNPRSGSGKTGKSWSLIARMLAERLGPIEARFTERPGHGIELARELIEQGFERILAVGGDGTINEVANGFLRDDEALRPEARLGILPLGTGGDFRRTLGISRRLEEAVEVLASGVPLRIDMGKAVFRGHNGLRQTRYFVNLVSFGMGGEVASRSGNFLNPLGGTVSFLYATAVAFFVYRKKQVRLELDGAEGAQSFEIYNIAVGNGRFHGGGMQACPTAAPNDGVLEVTVIDYLSRWEAIRDFPVLYSNNVYRHPKVRHLRGKRIFADADETVRIEVDGEPLGSLPIEITVLPQRLPVLVARGSPLF